MSFDPNAHLISIKGKPYLPAQARVMWFRDECPAASGWGIQTERIAGSHAEKFATFRATITDPEGRIVAQATKTEDVAGFSEFEEKAETSAIGRALALCGFGTQFALEFDEGERVVDSPREPKQHPQQQQQSRPPAAPKPVVVNNETGEITDPEEEKRERLRGKWGRCRDHALQVGIDIRDFPEEKANEEIDAFLTATAKIVRPKIEELAAQARAAQEQGPPPETNEGDPFAGQ